MWALGVERRYSLARRAPPHEVSTSVAASDRLRGAIADVGDRTVSIIGERGGPWQNLEISDRWLGGCLPTPTSAALGRHRAGRLNSVLTSWRRTEHRPGRDTVEIGPVRRDCFGGR